MQSLFRGRFGHLSLCRLDDGGKERNESHSGAEGAVHSKFHHTLCITFALRALRNHQNSAASSPQAVELMQLSERP